MGIAFAKDAGQAAVPAAAIGGGLYYGAPLYTEWTRRVRRILICNGEKVNPAAGDEIYYEAQERTVAGVYVKSLGSKSIVGPAALAYPSAFDLTLGTNLDVAAGNCVVIMSKVIAGIFAIPAANASFVWDE